MRVKADAGAVSLLRRDADIREHVGEAPDGIGAAAEAEEADAVARAPQADVGLDDLVGEANAERLIHHLVHLEPLRRRVAGRRRADARHVDGELPFGIDVGGRSNPRAPQMLLRLH